MIVTEWGKGDLKCYETPHLKEQRIIWIQANLDPKGPAETVRLGIWQVYPSVKMVGEYHHDKFDAIDKMALAALRRSGMTSPLSGRILIKHKGQMRSYEVDRGLG